MKKRNLISVILVVALLLSCSLSVFAAVPPKGETAEPQAAKILCEHCGTEATILNPNAEYTKIVAISPGDYCVNQMYGTHQHDLTYRAYLISCPKCGKYYHVIEGLQPIKICCHISRYYI